jgi:hypothetical protein
VNGTIRAKNGGIRLATRLKRYAVAVAEEVAIPNEVARVLVGIGASPLRFV